MVPNDSKRKERATIEQLKKFLDYCSKHPEILERKHRDGEQTEKLWIELTEQLNMIKGPVRTPKQWKRTLYHWKDQVISRVRKVRLNEVKGCPNDSIPCLTKFDNRALKVFGINIDNTLQSCTERHFDKIEQQSMDQANSSSVSDTATELHEMELPLNTLFHETNDSINIKSGTSPLPNPSNSNMSMPTKRHADILSPVHENKIESKRSFTQEIVIKLNNMDAKMTALNENLARIANAIEKIANKF